MGSGQTGEEEPRDSNRTSGKPKNEFPPGISPEKFRAIQDLFNSQPPESQKQLMNQALEFQKKMGKIPGFRKIAEQGVQTVEALLKQQSLDGKGNLTPGGISSSVGGENSVQGQFATHADGQRRGTILKPSPAASSGSGGVTLDELRKVNLGPEIEALFEELRSIREKKNHYRELYNKTKVKLESESKEKEELASSLNRVHAKLKRAEHEVILINSECMNLNEAASQVKSLTAQNRRLSEELSVIKASATSSGSPSYADLQRRLHSKEEALHSLQRKMERMRRRDPLLGFSIVCSDVARFCDSTCDPLKGIAEEAFDDLQANYMKLQQDVWTTAMESNNGAAAKAYVAVIKRFFSSRIPHYNYDAVMAVEGDVESLKDTVRSLGFVMSPMANRDGWWALVAQADAAPLTTSLGPYAYAFALWSLSTFRNGSSSNNNSSSSIRNLTGSDCIGGSSRSILPHFAALPYTVAVVAPYVSTTLVENRNRITVEYETARASGPGGQATNVTETQIHAKLSIDGAKAFSAQAQDSRSALQNKESATAKLMTQRRHQYNESLSKQQRAEEVEKNVLNAMTKVGVGTFATPSAEASAVECVQKASETGFISSADIALVQCFWILKKKLTEISKAFE
ncbi:unnamed protein product [Phytomonas sp. EM1]|nr:unnamed protein product [Phytomonas sp. EM1]|eukprot:CCW62949.1 unnamed protein product [Phytomonas sp. isolate EM1]